MKYLTLILVLLLSLAGSIKAARGQDERDYPVITPENADQVTELARFGYGKIWDTAVDPMGNVVAVATEIGIWLYDLTTNEPPHFWGDHTDWVKSVDFSPDGRTLLSGSMDETLRLWDVASGDVLQIFEGHTSGKFMIGGQTILSRAVDGSDHILDVNTGETLYRRSRPFMGLTEIAPDSETMLFVPYESEMWLVDLQKGMTRWRFEDTGYSTASVTYSADGQTILEGVNDGSLRLWNVQTGALLHVFETDRTGTADCVALSPDGRIAVSCSRGNNALHTWDVETGEHLQVFRGHETWITSVTFTPDGRSVLSSGWNDDALFLWDAHSGEILHEFQGHSEVWDVAFAADGQTIVSCGRIADAMRLWDIQSGEVIQSFAGNQLSTHTVDFAPDGKTVISGGCEKFSPPWGCGQGDLRLWDIRTGELLYVIESHPYIVSNVMFSPNGQTVLSSTRQGDLRLWDIDTGQMRWARSVHATLSTFDFAPDGQTVVIGGDTLHLFDVMSGEIIRDFEGHEDEVISVAFSPDGRTIVTGSANGEWRFWDVQTGETRLTIPNHADETNIAFASNGDLFASSTDSTIVLLDAQSGAILQELDGHRRAIKEVRFSPDGTLIASVSQDGTIRFWGVP